MAKVLMISKQGDGIPIALKLVDEGHKVDIYIKDSVAQNSLKGYTQPQVITRLTNVTSYDLILSDMVGLGHICERLQTMGRLVLGGGLIQDRLELDREYGTKVITRLTKVKESNTVKVASVSQLKRALQTGKAMVIKPLGNKTVDLTLVSKDDLNESLMTIVDRWGDKLLPCIVQEVVKGIEISSEGWFDGERFITPFNHTFEKKRLMEGDKGPQTGCMGNLVITTKGNRLTDMIFKPLEPFLAKAHYVGPLDANCIISGDDVYFLEFTARFGYDAIQAYTELLKIPLFDFLYKVAARQGNLSEKEEYYSQEMGMAVRLSLPPYPYSKADKWEGIQVLDLSNKGAKRHVWLADVMLEDKKEVMAGVDGVIGCITTRGINIPECRRRIYRTIDNTVINRDVQYRGDIGADMYTTLDIFKGWCNANN